MPWSGTGSFSPDITFIPDTDATAEDQNAQDIDFAAGITNCMAKDGQNAAVANLSMGGNKLTQLGAGTAASDAANFGQLGILLPSGIVFPYAGLTIPAGYFLCNGQAVSRTSNASLFTAIGTTYGIGDGLTTFNVPNLIGRVVAGVDATGTVLTTFSINTPGSPGGVGGSQGYSLSGAQLPVHNHVINISDPGHNHSINDPGHSHSYVETTLFALAAPGSSGFTSPGQSTPQTSTNGTGISNNAAGTGISASSNNAGSSTPILTMPPTMVMFYIIKT